MRARSKRRRREEPQRAEVRRVVLERDQGCEAEGIEGVPHGPIPGRAPLEVHELRRGSARRESYLEPGWCLAVCAQSHDWITEHPNEAERRGLALRSWMGPAERAEAEVVRRSWKAGNPVDPSWI